LSVLSSFFVKSQIVINIESPFALWLAFATHGNHIG